jgi:2-(1,2-epoxy-1,2-dihydrophenyl)acetyl-CoA isomerase
MEFETSLGGIGRSRGRRTRVLLMTGRGRGFCAGQDLSERNVDAGPVDLGETTRTHYNTAFKKRRPPQFTGR